MKISSRILIAALFFFLAAYPANAWDDCPLGITDDPYPGECPRYIDTNDDGYCDHGQSDPSTEVGDEEASEGTSEEPGSTELTDSSENSEGEYAVEIEGSEMKLLTIKEIAQLWNIDENTLLSEIVFSFELNGNYDVDTVLEDMRSEYKFSPALIKDIAESIKNGETSQTSKTATSQKNGATSVENPYNVGIPLFTTIFMYAILWYLTTTRFAKKYTILSQPVFKMIWNTVLVLSAIPSVLFGFYLTFRYVFAVLREVDFDFLYWHVEGSIVFGTVVILHLVTRLRQYTAPLKLFKKKSR